MPEQNHKDCNAAKPIKVRQSFHAGLAIVAILLVLATLVCDGASPIQSSNIFTATPGVTVGVRGGIPNSLTEYTNLSASNIDGTGETDVSATINSALANCPSNSYVLITGPGVFKCTTGLLNNKSGVELRSTNGAILVGHIQLGRVSDTVEWTNFLVTAGGAKGTTNLTMSDWRDFGEAMTPPSILEINYQPSATNHLFQAISLAGYTRKVVQFIVVNSRVNGDITFSPPLVWDFTPDAEVHQHTYFQSAGAFNPKQRVGMRNVIMTQSYAAITDAAQDMVTMSVVTDSYITGCTFTNSLYNYLVKVDTTVHSEVRNNMIAKVGAGPSHSGMLFSKSSGALVEDNIFADSSQIGLQLWESPAGNVFSYNYLTNNAAQHIDMHNLFPLMNIFEGNIAEGTGFSADGYYGSASRTILFRNYLANTTPLKRFSTYFQIVGNIAGSRSLNMVWEREESGYASEPWPVWQMGYPFMGNNGYTSNSPPIYWNDPGTYVNAFGTDEENAAGIVGYTNGVFVISNAPAVATNIIWTNMGTPLWGLTNYPAPLAVGYPIKLKDPTNPFRYYPDDNPRIIQDYPTTQLILTLSAGTSSNLTLNTKVWLTNGMRIYVGGQNAYPQLQQTNKSTHLFHGNYVYTNGAGQAGTITWDAGIADHDLPKSLIYGETKPSWMPSGMDFPTIEPTTGLVGTNYAFARYYGLDIGQGGGSEGGGDTPSQVTRTGGAFKIQGAAKIQ